jgi:hypothetical protein
MTKQMILMISAIVLTPFLVFVVITWMPTPPSKWDGAVLLKVCRDGTAILRLQDGSVRTRWSGRLVEDWQTVCG